MESNNKYDVKEAGSDLNEVAASEIEDNKAICDYTKYPREFVKYRWYRPLFVFAGASIFYTLFGFLIMLLTAVLSGGDYSKVIEIASGGYDSFDAYSPEGALLTLGSTAVIIPALALANMMSGGRTFKSYASSRGGWNFRIFFKCMLLALLISALPIVLYNIFYVGRMEANRFTVMGFILCTILGPLQCIAEEYGFRGLIMQSFGSWFRIPLLAVALQAAVFASMHPYDAIGVAEIAVSGVFMGLIAWISHGLEASSALHIANNMAIFYTVGFGFGSISTNTTWGDFFISISVDCIFLAVVIICRRRGMFDDVLCDDAAEYNRQVGEKAALKAFKKGLQQQAASEEDDKSELDQLHSE